MRSPTVILCLIVWVTVIAVRTHPANPLTPGRIFAILIAAGAWFVIGTCIERWRAEREDRR